MEMGETCVSIENLAKPRATVETNTHSAGLLNRDLQAPALKLLCCPLDSIIVVVATHHTTTKAVGEGAEMGHCLVVVLRHLDDFLHCGTLCHCSHAHQHGKQG